MTKNKFNKQTTKSQDNSKLICNNKQFDSEVHPAEFIANCTETQQLVLNCITEWCLKLKVNFLSYAKIGQMIGRNEDTVGQAVRFLHKHKLLNVIGRFKKTNIYRIPERLMASDVKYKLTYIIPALQLVFFGLLLSNNNCQSESLSTIDLNLFKLTNSRTKQRTRSSISQWSENIACERARARESKILSPGEEVMKRGEVLGTYEPQVEELLPKAVQNMQSIELTQAGQVWLSAFPEEIIRSADKALVQMVQSRKSVKEPFGYLFGICYNTCKKQNIKPNWEARNQLAIKLSISDNSPMYTNLKPQPIQSVGKRDARSFYKANSGESKSQSTQPVPFGIKKGGKIEKYNEMNRKRAIALADPCGEVPRLESVMQDSISQKNLETAKKNGFHDFLVELKEASIERRREECSMLSQENPSPLLDHEWEEVDEYMTHSET